MSSPDNIDTNINNYSRFELLDIVGLNQDASHKNIISRLETIINKYSSNNDNTYKHFFFNVRNKLLRKEQDQDQEKGVVHEGFIGENVHQEEDDQEEDDQEEDDQEEDDQEEDDQEEDDQEEDDQNEDESSIDKNHQTNNQVDQAETWYKNQYLLPSNQNQASKITQRHNSTQIFDTGSNPVMKQQMLGINNNMPLNVVQDSLNPVLRQIIWRHITIDSQYRNYSIPYKQDINGPTGSDTNFLCNLTEPLKNILSIRLKSLHIPGTWYTFDPFIGNTCFYIQHLPSDPLNTTYPTDISWNSASCCKICITPGNYSTVEALLDEINYDISFCCSNDLSGLHVFVINPRVNE